MHQIEKKIIDKNLDIIQNFIRKYANNNHKKNKAYIKRSQACLQKKMKGLC